MITKKISDIKIPKCFADTQPKEEKMVACRSFWEKHGMQDRYIVINDDGYLIDGYIQYLILKENNIEDVEVVFSNRKNPLYDRKPHFTYGVTTYVFAKHKNNPKEYVWRMPKGWLEKGRVEEIKPGDEIIVYTRYGFKVVTVTRIKTLSECPVNMTVYKILSKVKDGGADDK